MEGYRNCFRISKDTVNDKFKVTQSNLKVKFKY